MWKQPLYAKLLYSSLFSQFKYTDASNVSIKVFADSECFDEACRIASYFPEVEVVLVAEEFSKYTIINHPSLRGYDHIVLSDCDTFFYGKKHKIYQAIDKNNSYIYMMLDPHPKASEVFYSRMQITFPSPGSEEKHLENMSNCLKISTAQMSDYLQNNRWYLSCFMTFPRQCYRDDKWQDYCKLCFQVRTWCDETVFLTHGWDEDYKFRHFDKIRKGVGVVYATQTRSFLEKKRYKKILGIMHPLHGDFCHDMKITKLYKRIVD